VKLVDPTALNVSAGPSGKVVARAPMHRILANPSAMRVQEDQVPLYGSLELPWKRAQGMVITWTSTSILIYKTQDAAMSSEPLKEKGWKIERNPPLIYVLAPSSQSRA